MRGFIFTVDALFAAVVTVTLALSLYLLIEKMEPMPAANHPERDILTSLEKTGGFETISAESLAGLLSPYNRCGKLVVKTNGAVVREVVACPCSSDEVYSGARSFVTVSDSGAEYSVASLRTCMK